MFAERTCFFIHATATVNTANIIFLTAVYQHNRRLDLGVFSLLEEILDLLRLGKKSVSKAISTCH